MPEASSSFAVLVRDLRILMSLPDDVGAGDTEAALRLDGVVVALLADEAQDSLALYADLGALPRNDRDALMQAMLQANFGWAQTRGATLALEGQSQTVALGKRVPLQGLQGPALMRNVMEFAEVARDWQQLLASVAGGQAIHELGAAPDRSMAPPLRGMA